MSAGTISPPRRAPRRSPASPARSVLVTRQLGLAEPGYRLMVNMGHDGHQEVPHLHVHIFGGRQFRTMIAD